MGQPLEKEQVFDALGSPVRREIMHLLRGGPRPVGDIASRLPVSRPAVSKHLRLLEEAGLVTHEPQGTRNLYRLDQGGFAAAREWLDAFWDEALFRFTLVAENTVAENTVAENTVAENTVAGNTVAGNTVAGNTVAGNTSPSPAPSDDEEPADA